VYLHRLGTNNENDRRIFGFEIAAKFPLVKSYSTSLDAAQGSSFMVAEVRNGVGPYCELYTAGDWSQRLQQALATNPDEVLKLLGQTESYYAEAAPILQLPFGKFEASMRLFRDRLEQDRNPFAKVFLSPFVASRTREKEFRAMTDLAMFQTAVECKLHGAGVLKEVFDPVSGQPFSLASSAKGFTLSSRVTFDNQMVILAFRDFTGVVH
jgi:hypothetical protein